MCMHVCMQEVRELLLAVESGERSKACWLLACLSCSDIFGLPMEREQGEGCGPVVTSAARTGSRDTKTVVCSACARWSSPGFECAHVQRMSLLRAARLDGAAWPILQTTWPMCWCCFDIFVHP